MPETAVIAPQLVLEIAPEIEIKEPTKLVRIEVDKTAFDDPTYERLRKTAEKYNRLSLVASLLHAWAGKEQTDLETAKDDKEAVGKKIERISQQINKLFSLRERIGIADFGDEIKEGRTIDEYPEVTEEEIKKSAEELGLFDWPPGEIAMVRVNQETDLESRLIISSIVLHDTRSPLSFIKGYVELIEEDGLNDTYLNGVITGFGKVSKGTEYSQSLIENPFHKEPLKISQITDNLNTHLKTIGVEMSYSPPTEDFKVVWFTAWMESMAFNLAQNIDKAYRSKPNAEKIAIVGTSVEDDGRLKISVEDRGQGLPDEIIKKGFQPGFTKWAGAEGTGVGMHTHLIALKEHYGGDLIAENVFDESGKVIGAKISIILPVSQ